MDINNIQQHWLQLHEDSLKTTETLYEKGQYVHAMFFLHLTIEQLIKAIHVKFACTEPPFGHNLQLLIKGIQQLTIPEDKLAIFARISTFQISARYDDYKNSFKSMCTKEFASEQLPLGKELIEWLKSM